MIELSIVSGTYNRLPHMQRMVESVRQSIGTGIPYEIVLVDGGSTDGTIDWCKSQPDIMLIEQGELLGAIKAFNAGLHAAHGRYCVVGNDDVLYEDEALIKALAFMEDHLDVGVGCFYQDRDHPGTYNLEYMPAILDGESISHVYGQVCIVPKWLGEEVGWWGNYANLHTYGGDNNLSSTILERGYKVTGIECACIHDMKVDDELRKINNERRVKEKHNKPYHPDSVAWGKHWSHMDGTCGAIIRHEPVKSNPLKRNIRFLYLPIYEQGYAVQKQQKRGLREALANVGLVYEYDWLQVSDAHGGQYMVDYLMDIMDAWQPDMLLSQIHGPDAQNFNVSSVHRIRSEFPKVAWINWNGDYHPESLLSPGGIAMSLQFDMQCVVTTAVRDIYARNGVSWMYWQIGYESSTAEPNGNTPHYDVLFLGNGYSRARLMLGRMLRQLPYRTGIYGVWGGGIHADGYNLYDFDAGRQLYRAAKLSVGDNQWGNRAIGFVSNRPFQAMAAGGAMLMHQHVPDLDKLLGLEDRKHYVVWNDLADLQRKISYYLVHEDERKRIADTGTEFILKNHSFDNRVQELLEVMS